MYALCNCRCIGLFGDPGHTPGDGETGTNFDPTQARPTIDSISGIRFNNLEDWESLNSISSRIETIGQDSVLRFICLYALINKPWNWRLNWLLEKRHRFVTIYLRCEDARTSSSSDFLKSLDCLAISCNPSRVECITSFAACIVSWRGRDIFGQ